MSDDATDPRTSTAERRAVLLRQLSDARAILGCGDDPDRNAAFDEIERVQRELDALTESAEARRAKNSGKICRWQLPIS